MESLTVEIHGLNAEAIDKLLAPLYARGWAMCGSNEKFVFLHRKKPHTVVKKDYGEPRIS